MQGDQFKIAIFEFQILPIGINKFNPINFSSTLCQFREIDVQRLRYSFLNIFK